MTRYTTVEVTTDVDIDLTQIEDEDIRAEYYERNLGGGAEDIDEEKEYLTAYLAHHAGDKAKAYEILWKFCLIKLNKVV